MLGFPLGFWEDSLQAEMENERCSWCLGHPLYVSYHDQEWGVPEYDDRALFAKLILDSAQAGLSWLTVLKKREGYRRAFENFDPERMASFDERRIEELLQDTGIIRNRLKVESAVQNARAYLELEARGIRFGEFLWEFAGGRPVQNRRRTLQEIPAQTKESKAMSRALQGAGFRFVGPTICYAFMQAVGMVNDHVSACFRYCELGGRD